MHERDILWRSNKEVELKVWGKDEKINEERQQKKDLLRLLSFEFLLIADFL